MHFRHDARLPHPFATCLLGALALCIGPAVSAKEASRTSEARVARVEAGLSTPVRVKGAAGGKFDLRERMAFHNVPAVSIALIDQGRVQWTRAYGVTSAEGENASPVTPDTLFQAASVSKAVSAVGALELVQQARLSLDAPANDQLTAWKIPDNDFTRAKPVSLRMLLNHSAGMTIHGYDGYAQGQPLPTLVQILDGTTPANSDPVRVDVLPGSLWRYSGGGYGVVQLLMAEAAGQPFDRYMQQSVLAPLGMKHSTFAVALPPNEDTKAASGHTPDGHAVPGRWHRYPESAAAGLWTTPSDLAQVVLEVQRAADGSAGVLLSHDTAQMMLTRGLGEYGLGLYVEDLGDRTSFSHSGGTTGFRSQLYGYTHSGQGAVIMTNSDNGAALIGEILASISAEYGWPEFKVIEKVAIPGDAARNRQLAGRYALLGKTAELIAEDDRLYLQSDVLGAVRRELHAQSATRFFMTEQDMVLKVMPSTGGRTNGFELVSGSNTYAATRSE